MRTIDVLMAILVFSVMLGSPPVYADMQDDVDQAATIIERFQAVPENAISAGQASKMPKDWPS